MVRFLLVGGEWKCWGGECFVQVITQCDLMDLPAKRQYSAKNGVTVLPYKCNVKNIGNRRKTLATKSDSWSMIALLFLLPLAFLFLLKTIHIWLVGISSSAAACPQMTCVGDWLVLLCHISPKTSTCLLMPQKVQVHPCKDDSEWLLQSFNCHVRPCWPAEAQAW